MFASLIESFENGDYTKQTPIDFDEDAMEAHCTYAAPGAKDPEYDAFDRDSCGVQVMIVDDYGDEQLIPAAFEWDDEDIRAREDEYGYGEFVIVYED